MFRSAVKRSIFLAITVCCLLIACNNSPQATAPSSGSPSATSASSTAPGGTKTLTIADNPWPGYTGQYVAAAKDFFKAGGLEVEEKFFQAGSDSDTAFLAGKVDLCWMTGADLIQAASQDPTIKLIMQIDTSNGSDGILGRNINRPQDAKGKLLEKINCLRIFCCKAIWRKEG